MDEPSGKPTLCTKTQLTTSNALPSGMQQTSMSIEGHTILADRVGKRRKKKNPTSKEALDGRKKREGERIGPNCFFKRSAVNRGRSNWRAATAVVGKANPDINGRTRELKEPDLRRCEVHINGPSQGDALPGRGNADTAGL